MGTCSEPGAGVQTDHPYQKSRLSPKPHPKDRLTPELSPGRASSAVPCPCPSAWSLQQHRWLSAQPWEWGGGVGEQGGLYSSRVWWGLWEPEPPGAGNSFPQLCGCSEPLCPHPHQTAGKKPLEDPTEVLLCPNSGELSEVHVRFIGTPQTQFHLAAGVALSSHVHVYMNLSGPIYRYVHTDFQKWGPAHIHTWTFSSGRTVHTPL